MGKIKSKPIKRTAQILLKQVGNFSDNFEENKKILGDTLPSKKIRNQLAGYLAKLKKREKQLKVNVK